MTDRFGGKAVFRWAMTVLALSLPASASAAPQPIASVRAVYDGKVRPDVQANTFRNIDKLFPTRTVRRGAKVRPLPLHDRQLTDVLFTANGKSHDLADYLSQNRVSGLIVLKDGKIALEDYELGNTSRTRWMSMSVVKSISSTLVGAAIRDGHIRSIDDPVTTYLPELAGSAYDGVSIRNLLHMASGVKWNETYTDPASDRRRMLDLQIAQQPGEIVKLMAGLPRAAAPGTKWNYSTGETHIVGALIRAATKMPVADYLSRTIWQPAGMEADATWWLESPGGLEVGGSGLSATLRDYARFGQFFMENGVVGDRRILPDGWRDDASAPAALGDKKVDYYGYMWWLLSGGGPLHAGAFEAEGIFGQHVYINPAERVVIVVWSARSKPSGADVIPDIAFFGGVVEALKD